MIKRLSVFLLVFLFSYIILNNNVEAKDNCSIESITDNANQRFSISSGNEFNYLFVYEEDISDIYEKYNDVISDYLIDSYYLSIVFHLGNNIDLVINCYVLNRSIEYIDYYVDNILLIRVNSSEDVINKCDLSNYNNLFCFNNSSTNYDITSNISIGNQSKNSIYNDFINSIGIDYINGIIIKNEICGEAYYENTELSMDDLIRWNVDDNAIGSGLSFDGEEFIDTSKAGRYIINIYSYNDDGILYIRKNIICVYSTDCLKVKEANISYKTFVNQKNYINNYIYGPDDYFDKKKYIIKTDYFGKYNKVGTYPIELEYWYDSTLIKASGIINVIDNINPYFIGDNVIYGKLSETIIDIKDIFKDIKVLDEVDGDIKDKLIIEDLDNYGLNYDKAGEYNFRLSVKDNSNNEISNTFKYIVIDDTVNDEIDNNIEVDEQIDKSKEDERIDNVPSSNIVDNVSNNIVDNERTNIVDNERNINNSIKAKVNEKLTIDDIKRRLLFNGFINDDFKGEIITDYIGNEDKVGIYEVKVIDNAEIRYYNLIIEKSDDIKEESNNLPLIISCSIIGVILVIAVISIIIWRKIKLNK
ncbi:MAG: hypothetical protein IKP77_01355 [Acholeplasmatales bacterium]|nr:hypothetical protein [Acholeplasmatales bacterium]